MFFLCAMAAGALSGLATAWLLRSKNSPNIDGLVNQISADLAASLASLPKPEPFLLPDEPPLPRNTRELIEEVNALVAELIKICPNNVDALEMKARAEDWQGKTKAAIATWEECLRLNPQYVHAYVGMAALAARAGEHEKAAELARKAMELDPTSFRARDILAESLINLQRPAEAVEVLEEFLRNDPRSRGFFLLGRAYSLLDQWEKAAQAYQAAVNKYPRYAEAYYALARVQRRLGQRKEAQETTAKYWELMKQREPTRQGMETAVDDFKEMSINGAILLTDIGRVYFAVGQFHRAERLWQRAAKLDPHNVPCRQLLATLCQRQGRLWEAVSWYRELTQIESDNPVNWLEIGQLFAGSLQFEEAEAAFSKACEVAPERPDGYAALVRLYLSSGRKVERAPQVARTLVTKAPTAENYVLLAASCEQTGDMEGALSALKHALQLAPQNQTYQRMYERLLAGKPSAASTTPSKDEK
ncbi:MAG: tetratricopeptide repeat protein [Thermoguttaceae bacterium]|nr:tetratricopeptide repeat protein [Thermoguttaceae bacterium]